jgi:hypothetical protein
MEIDIFYTDKKMEEARIKELNNISHLLMNEVDNLKKQIMYILEGSNDLEGGKCNICGLKNKKKSDG